MTENANGDRDLQWTSQDPLDNRHTFRHKQSRIAHGVPGLQAPEDVQTRIVERFNPFVHDW